MKPSPIKLLFLCLAAAPVAADEHFFPRTEAELFPERLQLTLSVDPETLWNAQVITYKDLSRFVLESTPWGQDPYAGWEELIALGYWSGYQNPRALGPYLEQLRDELLARCPDGEFRVLEQSEGDVLYQWRVEQCDGVMEQTELGRFLASAHGVHQASYTRRGGALDAQRLAGWLQVLRDAYIKPVPRDFRQPRNLGYRPHWQRPEPGWRRQARVLEAAATRAGAPAPAAGTD